MLCPIAEPPDSETELTITQRLRLVSIRQHVNKHYVESSLWSGHLLLCLVGIPLVCHGFQAKLELRRRALASQLTLINIPKFKTHLRASRVPRDLLSNIIHYETLRDTVW